MPEIDMMYAGVISASLLLTAFLAYVVKKMVTKKAPAAAAPAPDTAAPAKSTRSSKSPAKKAPPAKSSLKKSGSVGALRAKVAAASSPAAAPPLKRFDSETRKEAEGLRRGLKQQLDVRFKTLNEAFRRLDENYDRLISRAEMQQALRDAPTPPGGAGKPSKQEIEAVAKDIERRRALNRMKGQKGEDANKA
ncbi:MAG: EF-hand domain-containing protein, partial [Pseudomonadota bacterium]|nr:EF-hand domain-containing protein [Pseudomonadota bacterium]